MARGSGFKLVMGVAKAIDKAAKQAAKSYHGCIDNLLITYEHWAHRYG